MKKLLLLLLLLPLTACGQMVPTSWQVSLTWTVPQPTAGSNWKGCVVGQSTCTYVISRVTVPAGTLTCPDPSGMTYMPLNQASPATGTVYNDTTATGLTVCYTAYTLQAAEGVATPAVSQPSNTAGPFIVPGNPLPPVLNGNMSASMIMPQIAPDAKAQVAKVTPMLRGAVVPTDGRGE